MTIHFGDNSTITTFASLPAIDGSALTNMNNNSSISQPIRQGAEATSTGVSETNSTVYSTKLELTIGTASNTRVMVFFGFEIQNSDGSDNQRTFAKLTGSNVSYVGPTYEVSTTGGYSEFNDQRLDISSHSGTRTYRIQYRKSSGNVGRIRNAYICAIAMNV